MSVMVYKGYPYFVMGHNWCAKCSECGEALTKFCFEAEEAKREGESALPDHRCKRRRG